MRSQEPANQTRRLGQGMFALACIIALGLLTWTFSSIERHAQNPNQNPQAFNAGNGSIEVKLDRNRSGHYVISGQINGVNVDFILDTGATDVVIPERVAIAAKLDAGYPGQAMTANGPVTIYSTRINSLKLSLIELTDVRASINPAMHDSMVLLGMSALRQIEFTQKGDQLTLRYTPDII